MRKLLLSFALLVAGAMTVGAQELVLTYENITAPQELSAEDATKIRGFQNGMTIVADVEITNTSTSYPPSVLFAAVADYTSNSTSNNSIWALGFGGNQMRYIVGPRDGGWYSRGSVGTTAKKIIYTNNNGNEFGFYVDGTSTGTLNTSAPQISTFNDENAKFYLGGLVYNNNTEWGNFNGTISKVEIYDGVLTADQIAALCYPANAVTDYTKFVHGNVYTFQTVRGWLMAQENTDFVYSSGKLNDVTPAENNANCQWVYYATEKGKYLYNVAVGKFVSYNSANLNSIPLSENPTTSAIEFQNSTLGGYPILLGVESKVVNHNLTNNSFTYGALLWGDGWTGYHNDEGSASLVLSQGAATAETLAAIKTKVDAFEADNTVAKEGLNAAITAMEEWVASNVGVGVGKYTYNGDGTIDAKIQEYKDYRDGITEKNNPAPAEVEAKTAEVRALKNSFVINQPETGKFYRLKNHQSGWYATSDVRTSESSHNNKLYMANENNTARTVWYLTADNKLLSYTKGQYLGDMSSDWSFEAIGAEGNVVTFNESAHEGKYQIIPSSGRALFGDQIRVDAAGSGNNSGNYAWTIEEVTWLPVEIVPEVGYATLFSPVQLGFNDRVIAYTGTLGEGWLTLNEQTVVPANTGVLLTFESNVEVVAENDKKYVYLPVQATSVTDVESALVGYTETKATFGNPYTLQRHDFDGDEVKESVAFKKYTGESLTGYKAYLVLPTEAPAIGIRFEDGTTGIDHSELTIQNSELIFDLMGRRVETMTEGNIYIVNGRKVVR